MGPLSRLMAHSVENVRDPWLIQTMVDDLASFARALTTQWRQNKLSEIDASEETVYLDDEALRSTLPVLWKLLKAALFATTIVLRGVLGRILSDVILAADGGLLASSFAFVSIVTWLICYSCTCTRRTNSSYSTPPILYIEPPGTRLVQPTHICVPHGDRHSDSLPYPI
jgi:hypothetical protein